jgi:hypothetical protein
MRTYFSGWDYDFFFRFSNFEHFGFGRVFFNGHSLSNDDCTGTHIFLALVFISRKIIIKIIQRIILNYSTRGYTCLPACAGAPQHIRVSTAYHLYTSKGHKQRLGRT